VAVGFGGGQFLGRERAVGAGLVQHGHRLLEVGPGRVGEGPGDEVGASARVLPDEQADRPFRELRGGVGFGVVEVATTGGQRQKGSEDGSQQRARR
jgi:hypothetical protein